MTKSSGMIYSQKMLQIREFVPKEWREKKSFKISLFKILKEGKILV